MANFQLIRVLIKKRNLSFEALCDKADISTQALRDAIKRNSTKTEYIERIAKILNVPISYFFEDGINEDQYNRVEDVTQTTENIEITHLKNIIEEKNTRIEELKDHIKTLQEKIKSTKM